MITILGPTATGKTRLAAGLAYRIDGEIISADSRQVYRGMDIGTGKDIEDYNINGQEIPFHLIDIVDPGYEYNVFEFQRDFLKAYQEIIGRKKQVVLCGGSGLYLEAIIKRYPLHKVPEDKEFRKKLESVEMDELAKMLEVRQELHNITDITGRKRLIRALEIAEYYQNNPDKKSEKLPQIPNIIFGVFMERSLIRNRITKRLNDRLKHGMIKEVDDLLNKGLKPEQLMYYGLEYKFLTQYVMGMISYDEMFEKLNTAIHQFAKRQMTWFRRMERNGIRINWLNSEETVEKNTKKIIELVELG